MHLAKAVPPCTAAFPVPAHACHASFLCFVTNKFVYTLFTYHFTRGTPRLMPEQLNCTSCTPILATPVCIVYAWCRPEAWPSSCFFAKGGQFRHGKVNFCFRRAPVRLGKCALIGWLGVSERGVLRSNRRTTGHRSRYPLMLTLCSFLEKKLLPRPARASAVFLPKKCFSLYVCNFAPHRPEHSAISYLQLLALEHLKEYHIAS